MRDFIVVAPIYTRNSNGIKTMHKICHSINQNGGKARMLFLDSNDPNCQVASFRDASWTNPDWNTPPLQESERHLIETSCVIYPEVIYGNPLQSQRVVRFFGNREGYCNGRMINFGANDFLAAHSTPIRKDAHYILFNSDINLAFHDRGAMPAKDRKLSATYFGKGYLYGEVGRIEDTVIISRDWPPSQEDLGELLRKTGLFYTWDSWTSTNVEAVLCGAVPFFMSYGPWSPEDVDSSEIGRIPRLDMHNPQFDADTFEQERQVMAQRIRVLTASWDERVRGFMGRIERHFDERGV